MSRKYQSESAPADRIRAAIAANPGKSNRQIAKELGVLPFC
jgi:hypothetical protein